MSMLLFYVGENRYAVDNQCIVKIIPRVFLKKMPYAPPYLAGLLNWEGKPIPIVNFCHLIEQREACEAFHTRIILIKAPHDALYVGIMGEKVIDIANVKASQFSETGFYLSHFPYLSGVYNDQNGIIQKLDVAEFFKFLSVDFFPAIQSGDDGQP